MKKRSDSLGRSHGLSWQTRHNVFSLCHQIESFIQAQRKARRMVDKEAVDTALARRLGGGKSLSLQTIDNYKKGKTAPEGEVLLRALEFLSSCLFPIDSLEALHQLTTFLLAVANFDVYEFDRLIDLLSYVGEGEPARLCEKRALNLSNEMSILLISYDIPGTEYSLDSLIWSTQVGSELRWGIGYQVELSERR